MAARISVCLMALGLVACAGAPVAAQAPVVAFEKTACPERIAAGEKVDCGVLTVPEKRGSASARTVRLPVTIFRSRSATPAADPIVYLAGGPGLGNQGPRSGASDPFLAERDRIYLEPRGARFSTPRLACPEISNAKLEIAAGRVTRDAREGVLVAAAKACRAWLGAQGIDLSGYVSTETADDVEDMRKALGLGQINLYGLSYGTRLSLTMVRRHPGSVRSVILDSTLPPEADFDEVASNSILRAFNMVFDGCAVNAACAAVFPKLRETFFGLVAQADREPLAVGAKDGVGNPVIVHGRQVVSAFYDVLHEEGAIATMPRLIADVAGGKHEFLKPMFEGMGPSNFEWGLRLSVWCAEEVPFEDAGRVAFQVDVALGLGGTDERTANAEICRAWNVPATSADEDAAVLGNTPVLIFSGAFDPDTPTDWARAQLVNLPNARLVVMPGGSHGASFNACAAGVSMAFLRDPTAPLDMDCVAKLHGPDFGASARPN